MSWYYRRLFPWLLDLSMKHPEVERYRRLLVPQAKGRVLEIGIGSGLNLPFYGAQIEQVCGLEPSAELREMAARRAQKSGRSVELLDGSAERILLPDHSVDCVVSTWTLCSIPDVKRALHEVRRVLKPDGELLFVEHGLAPDRGVQIWQHRLTPWWSRIAGGCHLDRNMQALISGAGFGLHDLHTEYAKGPRLMTYMYWGRARPV
ncbi:MAG TPA: class I SAM-dependent methyltransferase [Steroidobacteraceae bacterium]|jgi:ubiquinone/menaquinone biosynthesis C-methylase UbiE|nr:class I SAM-dependent methyltransferase [Steroidobacteraceae bacterium]